MIKTYWKVAIRNLLKRKTTTLIHITGLAVGLACCMLILLYFHSERAFDKGFDREQDIYRITSHFKDGSRAPTVAFPFGTLLRQELPEVEAVTRMDASRSPCVVKALDDTAAIPYMEQSGYWVDPNFFDIFSFHFLYGDRRTALSAPNSIVLSETAARWLFGNKVPIGRRLRAGDGVYIVGGVFRQDMPNHLDAGFFASNNSLGIRESMAHVLDWVADPNYYTYIRLRPGSSPAHVTDELHAYTSRHAGADMKRRGEVMVNSLQALGDIHLHSSEYYDYLAGKQGNLDYMRLLASIAAAILLLGCINYMNLSTARSALRAKEIGIRKTSGAQRSEIIIQFLSESVLITAMATLLAVGLTWLTLPALNAAIAQTLSIQSLLTLKVIIPLLLTPFVIGIISGIYPALFMSSFQPVKVLKGLFKAGSGSISFRKVLVVAQFSISIILIICTAIVFQQLHYMQEKSLGFDKERIVTVGYDRSLDMTYETFRNELRNSAYIKDVSRSSRIPSGRLLDEQGASTESGDSLRPVSADIKYVSADFDFVPTYGMHVRAGRNFSRAFGTDTTAFILNAAAARALGLQHPEQAVGRNFQYGGKKGRIVGVLDDFHFESMHQQIVPLVLAKTPENTPGFRYNFLSVKIAGNNIAGGLAHLENTWKKFLPQTPFEYTFLDEKFDQLYRSEQRQGTLFTTFSGIAIFIACLGLLGLSAFAISQRIKEIGIRKVLGASVSSIVTLLSTDFLKLVAIAAVIAFPVAWYAMHNWLMDFAYRISIQWWIFLVAGILATAVALITIGFQAIRAALSPPVKSLRTE